MASVLKQDSFIRGTRPEPIAFNIQDMQSRAKEYLAEVQVQAEELLERARREAIDIKAKAREEGIKAAQVEMQKRIEESAAKLSDQKCRTAIESCQQAVAQMSDATAQWLTQWRNQTVQLAARIADKLARAHLTDHNELLRVWMEEAIVALRDERDLRLLVNPDDFALAGRFLQELARTTPHAGTVEVIPDPSIKLGGCVVKSKNGQIDQQLETQLQRLVDQLEG
jgi:flagellar assembly protein FliH